MTADEPFDEQRLAVVVVVERGEQLGAVVDAHDAQLALRPVGFSTAGKTSQVAARSRRAVGAMNSERGLQSAR